MTTLYLNILSRTNGDDLVAQKYDTYEQAQALFKAQVEQFSTNQAYKPFTKAYVLKFTFSIEDPELIIMQIMDKYVLTAKPIREYNKALV